MGIIAKYCKKIYFFTALHGDQWGPRPSDTTLSYKDREPGAGPNRLHEARMCPSGHEPSSAAAVCPDLSDGLLQQDGGSAPAMAT